MAAAVLAAPDAVAQEHIESRALNAKLHPERLASRSDMFDLSFETPAMKDGLAPTRTTTLFACILKRDASGAPLRTYKKEVNHSKGISGIFRMRPTEFLEDSEQLVELHLKSVGEYSNTGSYAADAFFALPIAGEPSIPNGFTCDQKLS